MENSHLKKYLDLVEQAVQNIHFPAEPRQLYTPMDYILGLGGKRIRPVLTLMACEACGKNASEAIQASLAVELFHNFSLIHDDIMDKAPLRRGKSTVHEKWNTNIAILSGDAMLVRSYQCLLNYSPAVSQQLIELFSKTAIEVCEGQQMDMDFETETKVSIPDYLEMIRLKTAVLLGGSLAMGGLVAGTSESNIDDLYEFGVHLGIAFQLQDDILDLYTENKQFGKQAGGDILANKKTFLLLKAFERANTQQRIKIDQMLNETDAVLKIEQAKTIFDELDIEKISRDEMDNHYSIALKRLNHLSIPSENKTELTHLAQYLMNRDH